MRATTLFISLALATLASCATDKSFGPRDTPGVRLIYSTGSGDLTRDIGPPSNLNDTVDGDFDRFGAIVTDDDGVGGGIVVETFQTEMGINQVPGAPSGFGLENTNIFLFTQGDAASRNEWLRSPIRFGFDFNSFESESLDDSSRISWDSYLGLKLEWEPELIIGYNDNFEWTIFGGLNYAFGLTEVEVDNVEFEEVTATSYGYEVGTRVVYKRVELSASYVTRVLNLPGTEQFLGSGEIFESDNEFSGALLGIGLHF